METGVAVYDGERGLLGHEVYSQIKLHADYGGVVPELASRDHVRKLAPMVRALLQGIDLKAKDIDGVAYTAGSRLGRGAARWGRVCAQPGVVMGCSSTWCSPHGRPFAGADARGRCAGFPLCRAARFGGHTQLVRVDAVGVYELLGESVDDAAGEAFDKTAKLLGLGYPGGPALAALAQNGDPARFRFPRPMTDRPGLDFSFSGLKTFALTTAS